eukprot:UN07480
MYGAKYNTKEITFNYVRQMKIDRAKCEMLNALELCVVKICNDEESKVNGICEREIIGVVEKENDLYVQFRLVLVPYKHHRLFAVNSML